MNAKVYRLEPKQQQILELMARGYTNGDIAEHTGLAVKTVEFHIGKIYNTLSVPSKQRLLLIDTAEKVHLLPKGTVLGDFNPLAELTHTENNVLKHYHNNLSPQEVADVMFIKKKTVDAHVGSIITKLSIDNIVQAVLIARGKDVRKRVTRFVS